VEEDDDDEDCTRALPCFSDVGAPAFENKHRKDRNCFSERFDSNQMNLLKYTRNSTSRQYLHGRDYISVRIASRLLNPRNVSMTRRYGAMWTQFLLLQSSLIEEEKNHTSSESFFAMFRSGTRSVEMVPSEIDVTMELIAKIRLVVTIWIKIGQ